MPLFIEKLQISQKYAKFTVVLVKDHITLNKKILSVTLQQIIFHYIRTQTVAGSQYIKHISQNNRKIVITATYNKLTKKLRVPSHNYNLIQSRAYGEKNFVTIS